jgi:hypothetical protein
MDADADADADADGVDESNKVTDSALSLSTRTVTASPVSLNNVTSTGAVSPAR